jgi:hypothetical protein
MPRLRDLPITPKFSIKKQVIFLLRGNSLIISKVLSIELLSTTIISQSSKD